MSMTSADVLCPLSYPDHGKYALPRKAVKSRPKRCLEASCRSIGTHTTDPGSDIRYYVSVDGLPYFTRGPYITTSNLSHPGVRLAFDRAVSMIEECLALHNETLDGCEVTIILRCMSLRQLKFRYYMVDHNRKKVRWIHGEPIQVERENTPTDKWVGYWEHLALFPMHRFCTPRDYRDALGILDAMRTADLDPTLVQLEDATIVTLSDMLRRLDSRAINQHITVSVAKTFQKIYEPTVAQHRTSLVPRKAVGAMKSLYGAFSVFTSWAHHRDHKEGNVGEQQHPSNHSIPDTPPRSSVFNPKGPDQSATEDNWQPGLRHRTGRQADGGA